MRISYDGVAIHSKAIFAGPGFNVKERMNLEWISWVHDVRRSRGFLEKTNSLPTFCMYGILALVRAIDTTRSKSRNR